MVDWKTRIDTHGYSATISRIPVTHTCSYTSDGRHCCGHTVDTGESLCPFHSSSTRPADFQSAFIELAGQRSREGVALDATGFEFPDGFSWPSGDFRVPVILYKAHFIGAATLRAVVFHEDVDFSEARVDRALLVDRCQFRQSLIMPGLSNLISLTIDYSRIDVNLLLSETPFSANVDIRSSTIRGDCVFSRSEALAGASVGKLSLRSVTLDDLILHSLQGKTLIDSVRVRGNVAAGDTTHWGEFEVKSTAVDGDFRVSSAVFKETVSVGVTAKGTIFLNRATFVRAASLANSSFYGPVTCDELVIGAGIDFSGSYFGNRLLFTTTVSKGNIKFQGVAFCGLVRVATNSLPTGQLSFAKSMFSAGCLLEIVASNGLLDGPLDFSDVFVQPGYAIRLTDGGQSGGPVLDVNRIDFRRADVQRFDLDLNHAAGLSLRLENSDVAHREAADIYRGFRHSHQKHLRYAEAGQFFIKEMDERRWLARHNGEYLQSMLLGLYRWLSLYGESYWRPSMLLVAWTVLIGLMATGTMIPAQQLSDVSFANTTVAIASALRALVFDSWLTFSTGLRVVIPLSLPKEIEQPIIWPTNSTTFYVVARLVSISLASFIVIALRRQFQRRPGEDS